MSADLPARATDHRTVPPWPDTAHDDHPDRTAGPDRDRRRLVALEVQLAELERSRRRTLMLGPILLLVLANVTPLVIAHPKDDPDESYTSAKLNTRRIKPHNI